MSTTTKSALQGLSLAALTLATSCAPSLSSQVSTVSSLAHVHDLPALREAEVDPGTDKAALALLKQPLDADAAVRIAMVNSRELRAQLRELGVPASRLLTAGLVANPTFAVELLPERDSKYEVRAEYDLTSLIVAPMRRGGAEDELEAARFSAAAAVVDLGYRVRGRFYALQAASQRLALAQQALDALAAARDASRALVEAGNIGQLDAASQIAAYERARVDVAKLELEVAQRREEVQRILGLHGEETAWQIKDALPGAPDGPPAFDNFERSALEANLDMRASKKRLDALSKQSGVVRTQAWLPEVAADVHALRVKNEGAAAPESWLWGAGVTLQLPLFDRGQGRLMGIEAEFDASLERYQGLAIDVRSAARDARNQLLSAYARAHQYQAVIVPAEREVLQQTLLQYNAMQIGVFQLLSTRRELLDAELAYVDTLKEYWTAKAGVDALAQGRVVGANEPGRSTDSVASNGAEGAH